MNAIRPLLATVIAVSVGFVSAEASAQRIISYGDEGGGAVSGTSAQTTSAAPTSAPATSGAGDADTPVGSPDDAAFQTHRFNLYGGPTAQSVDDLARIRSMEWQELYRGIIPGRRDSITHLERAQADGKAEGRPNQVTWIGFVPEDGRTRVFVQAARTPQYQVTRSADGKTLTLTFDNTRLPERNFSRFIDTRYFERNVTRIQASQSRDVVRVKIELDAQAEPQISRDGGYLYLDFPHSKPAPTAQAQ